MMKPFTSPAAAQWPGVGSEREAMPCRQGDHAEPTCQKSRTSNFPPRSSTVTADRMATSASVGEWDNDPRAPSIAGGFQGAVVRSSDGGGYHTASYPPAPQQYGHGGDVVPKVPACLHIACGRWSVVCVCMTSDELFESLTSGVPSPLFTISNVCVCVRSFATAVNGSRTMRR